MTRHLTFLALAAAMTAGVATADARELRLAPAAPPAHPAHTPLYSSMMEFLPEETNGELTGIMLGTEVVNIGNVKTALQSQVAEVGNFLPLYFNADVPNTALAGDLALLGLDPYSISAAFTEYVVTCGDCQEEFKRVGAVFAGSGSSDVYMLLTTKPVRTKEDLQGLRLRSGGAPYTRWAENVGAVPVNVPVSDTFESMSQGVINGTMASISDLVSYRLIDLVTHATVLPLGTYHTTSNFTVALPAWQSFSPELRAQFVRAANRANVLMSLSWGYERPERIRQQAEEAGIEFIEPDPALLEETIAYAEADIDAAIEVATTQLGIPDAEEKINHFRELIDKWTAIIEPLNGDTDAIAAVMQTEIWDKVDYETYGL